MGHGPTNVGLVADWIGAMVHSCSSNRSRFTLHSCLFCQPRRDCVVGGGRAVVLTKLQYSRKWISAGIVPIKLRTPYYPDTANVWICTNFWNEYLESMM